MVVYGSGDIGDVLVKAECLVHSDSEVFDMIRVCYWLVVDDDKCCCVGYWFVVAW